MEDRLQVFLEYTATKRVGNTWPAEYVYVVPKKGDVFLYGDLKQWQGEVTPETKKTLYIEIECCCGGDYGKWSEVAVSNHRSFLRLFKTVEGVHGYTGGFGTFGVVVRADVAESNKEIKRIIDDLENYPVVDEDDLYKLQETYQNKALSDPWFYDSFRSDIHLENSQITGITKLLANNKWLKRQILKTIFDRGGQVEWEYECGGAYLRRDQIVPYLEDRLLLTRGKKSIWPSLVNRKWSTPEYEEHYLLYIASEADLLLLVDREWQTPEFTDMYENRIRGRNV
jgi:hypothetical protein